MKQDIWIIGAGKFGRLAADRLKDRHRITLVDRDKAVFDKVRDPGIRKVCRDGVAYLAEHLGKDAGPAWIVPCLPKHLAWEWCRKMTGHKRLVPVEPPEELDFHLPNPMRTDAAHLYTSHADFICPDRCEEPADICSCTGKKRKPMMFSLIRSVSIKGVTPLVIRSRQLAPGVGGYSPAAMFQLLEQVLSCRKGMIVSTACKCHGVVNAGRLHNQSDARAG